jgi:lipopolysaccharide/colanic/teichoic acid biosynthesis glycosyltransferase
MAHGLRRLARAPLPDDPNLAHVHKQAIRGEALVAWASHSVFAGILESIAIVVITPLSVPIYVLLRLAGKRPWVVSARRVGSHYHREWKVMGWRASGRVIDEIADDLAHQRSPWPQLAERRGDVVSFTKWD